MLTIWPEPGHGLEIESMDGLSDIQIIEQPDWISDDEIADVLHDAHQTTLAAGMHYSVLTQNGADIRARLGGNGRFFVALKDGKELVGVSGISFFERSKSWYAKGQPYAEVKLEGVRNEFKGMGINGLLHKRIYEYAFDKVNVLVTNTAVQNSIVRRNDLKRGWTIVDFTSWKSTDYYSVVMAKWKDGCPYSKAECRFRFLMKKCRVMLLKNRFGQTRAVFRMMNRKRNDKRVEEG